MTDGAFASPFPVEDPGTLAALEESQGRLADAVRVLADATVRTRVGVPDLAGATDEVESVTARLLAQAQAGPLGMETDSTGFLRDHGNAMVGMRNPLAPPLEVTGDGEGRTRCTLTLGAGYEGPPGCVHGGIIAAILDQVVGSVPARMGLPGMTAYLNTTYRRPTPLGEQLTCRGWVDRVDGWKVYARGEIRDAEDGVTAEGEALFVVPRWAREHLGTPTGDAAGIDPEEKAAPGPATS